MKYPKINTIWKRDSNHKVIEYDYSCDEFESIRWWLVTEKIDGTNIRIISWKDELGRRHLEFRGRTDNAEIPKHLFEKLEELFTVEKIDAIWKGSERVILYGEGFGNKIQKNGNKYRSDDVSFMLFDAYIDGWWLEWNSLEDIAEILKIEIVPSIGVMKERNIVEKIRWGFESRASETKLLAEGVVARSHPLMLFRNGKPIVWKLKTKDYGRC